MSVLSDEQRELCYLYYLDDIERYLRGTLSSDRLEAILVSMANEGIAWKLTGPLRAEFDAMLADGRIQGVIQNAWDELNECVMESCYEKTYFTRADAELVRRCQQQEAA